MTEDMKLCRKYLQDAVDALDCKRDEQILSISTIFDEDNPVNWAGRAGSAAGSLSSASFHLNAAERKAVNRETDLVELLANAVIGWACDLIEKGELEIYSVRRHIRDFGGDALKDYSSLAWGVEGAPPGRCEGDLLVGHDDSEADPVIYDLCSCERVDDDEVLRWVAGQLEREVEAAGVV